MGCYTFDRALQYEVTIFKEATLERAYEAVVFRTNDFVAKRAYDSEYVTLNNEAARTTIN